MFIAALLTIAKTGKQPKCPSVNARIQKVITHACAHTHTHTLECYSATQREILPFAATRTNLEGTVLSDVSQTGKDKHCTIALLCGV